MIALANKIGAAVAGIAASLSPRAWAEVVGASLIVLGTWFVLEGGFGASEKPWAPKIQSAEGVELGTMDRSDWGRLLKHEPPAEVDTTCSVLPASFLENEGPAQDRGNGLPEVRYQAPKSEMRPPQIPYLTVPVTDGRPALDVGADVVRLRGANPRTGAPLTYEYDVPRPSWGIDLRGQALVGRKILVSQSTLGVWHQADWWRLRVAAGVGAGWSPDGLFAGPMGTVGITRSLWEW